MADGHLNKCRDCTKIDARRHRLENAETVRAYDRERARRPERVAKRSTYAKAYRYQNPEKRAAHTALGNAVRSGKLKKQPCAFCGSGERLEAHHHDYNKPLDVTWLCSACHGRFHALEAMATYREDRP
ncbi:hypothetical protein BSL82_09710 [Tardibacter chloracetimidivorans]|uniref:Uncharacterized protein n=1 Tax=Tardibacter chloracetimidivorans TaxID=1921510 RepID=A0A1L3ZZK3_9SPHN|nr:hypothetical protein BSL82_09710 [Tardibacter chloracetimidivorans]